VGRERPITVAHLLEHTSGFRDWNKAEFDHNDATPVSLEDGLAFSPESRIAHWKPGMHSVYSNSNYGLAGLVLEHVAAQNYEEVIRKYLFVPLEMRSATSLPERPTGLATGYSQNGFSPMRYWNMIQRPAAAINATPREMAALVSMLLNRGVYRNVTVLRSIALKHRPHRSPRATDFASDTGSEYTGTIKTASASWGMEATATAIFRDSPTAGISGLAISSPLTAHITSR
jgi:CubicO group peptidase (beta-lactamase class C family)